MNCSRFLAIIVKNITNVWNYFWNQQEMEENAGDMYGKRVNLIITVVYYHRNKDYSMKRCCMEHFLVVELHNRFTQNICRKAISL